jgi:hypothetical protein
MQPDNNGGNFPTLQNLGYEPALPGLELENLKADPTPVIEELIQHNKYIEFYEGSLKGIIWFNRLFKKWFCDIWQNSAYVETLMDEKIETILENVRGFYSDKETPRFQ